MNPSLGVCPTIKRRLRHSLHMRLRHTFEPFIYTIRVINTFDNAAFRFGFEISDRLLAAIGSTTDTTGPWPNRPAAVMKRY